MRVVVAPNAFKGSLTATAAAAAMAAGVRAAVPDAAVTLLPIADGGDGFVAVVHAVRGGVLQTTCVTGPRGAPVTAAWLYFPAERLAVIEMAQASGLVLLTPAQYDPREATTRGTGELVRAALAAGATRIVVGLGGSATCDGGLGLAAALGFGLCDAAGRPVAPNGRGLAALAHIDRRGVDPRLATVQVEGLTDVTNPLCGAGGAAAVYAPQKGADAAAVRELDAGLDHLAAVVHRELGCAVRDLPGAGAAGGLGAGLAAFCGATLRSGIDALLDLVGFAAALSGADLVLTGEGQLDRQTAHGKAPAGVARRAAAAGVPCFGFAGAVPADPALLHAAGFAAVFPIVRGPAPLAEALHGAAPLLTAATAEAVRAFAAGRAVPREARP